MKTRIVVFVLLLLSVSSSLWAHPRGNFSINHHSTLRVSAEGPSVDYVLDFAEIPTFQMFPEVRSGTDDARVRALAGQWLNQLHLDLDGGPVALEQISWSSEATPGAGGLPTLRVTLHLIATAKPPAGILNFHDDNFPNRIGWKEIVVAADSTYSFPAGNPYNVDRSNGLRNYPADLISMAPDVVRASIRIARGQSQQSAVTFAAPFPGAGFFSGTMQKGDRLSQILSGRQLSPGLILLGIAIAFVLGAMHALSPGHGKTVVAAYLVGNRGTAKHAVFLGAVVTFTHTVGVFLLGVVTLFLSRYIVPEKLYPVLGVASGVMIMAIGARLFHEFLHVIDGHQHVPDGHSHEVPQQINFSNLFAPGFSGGIVPCPSALVVLLSAIALHRIEVGLLFIVAFSIGLASVLVSIGLLVVRTSGLLSRFESSSPILRIAPVLSAAIISLLGMGVAIQSIAGMDVSFARLSLGGEAFAVLGLGLFLGLKHATEPDHVVAVTTFVSQERNIWRSCWVGAFWGVGHTLSLAIAGVIVILLRVNIPDWISARLELVVAAMLVGLGLRALIRLRRGGAENSASRQSAQPVHNHSWTRFGLRPLLVGMVHGAAGSAALMLLVLSTIGSPLEAFLYIVIFGVGSIAGMLAISILLALPLHWAKGRMVSNYQPIQLLAGLFSCLFGLYYGTHVWMSLQ